MLVPLDRVPVVHRELMVQIVIAFADSDECGDHVVVGSVLVIERRLSEPVRERTSIMEVPPRRLPLTISPETTVDFECSRLCRATVRVAAVDQTIRLSSPANCTQSAFLE